MPSNTFPSSVLELSSLQDPDTPSILDLKPFLVTVRDPSVVSALERVNDAFNLIQEVMRSTPPTLRRLSVGAADIEDLTVSGEFGPGAFQVLNGGPNYDIIGWIGSQPSATSVNLTSIVAGLVTSAAAHTLKVGDNVYIDSTTDPLNAGFYVVATTPLTTTFTVTGGVTGGNSTGGTLTKQFQGAWLKSAAIGGTAFNNAKLIADVDGSMSITDATITLNGSASVITLDPVIGKISLIGQGALATDIIISAQTDPAGNLAGILIRDPANPITSYLALGRNFVNITQENGSGAQPRVNLDTAGLALLPTSGGATIVLTTSSGNIDITGVYKKGGAAGLTATRIRGTGLTVNSIGTGVFGTPGVGQSNGTVVTGVTLTTSSDGFSGGILTT